MYGIFVFIYQINVGKFILYMHPMEMTWALTPPQIIIKSILCQRTWSIVHYLPPLNKANHNKSISPPKKWQFQKTYSTCPFYINISTVISTYYVWFLVSFRERCFGGFTSHLGYFPTRQVTVPCMLWGFGTAIGELHLGGQENRLGINGCFWFPSKVVAYGCFLKWWYPKTPPKWSFLVRKPMVVGYHHF